MNHHEEAWKHVEPQLFGTVCEVVRKKPWGFKEDRDDIITKTVDEFLSETTRYDTVLLHILSGEGEKQSKILDVVDSAYDRAVKVIILEHNPHSRYFIDKISLIGFIFSKLGERNIEYLVENWGRNFMICYTTLDPLCIPDLSDRYVSANINKTYITKEDHGICVNNLIYTHTSESPIDYELPDRRGLWIIGGGIPFESSRSNDIWIDSTLRQCLYAALIVGIEKWKIDRIYKFKQIKELKGNWSSHWREVEYNGVSPSKIWHVNIANAKFSGGMVYVSTVRMDFWEHLIDQDNIILDAWTEPRDKIKLMYSRDYGK